MTDNASQNGEKALLILPVPRVRTGPPQFPDVPATRDGRWGVHQIYKGRRTGGGTSGCGWATEREAMEQNPPYEGHGGVHTYEPFQRWGDES